MIFGMLLIGIILISTALKGTEHELGAQLERDLLGAGGFITWVVAILVIGMLGLIGPLRQPSRYLLALLAVVFLLKNNGVFGNMQAAITKASSVGPAPSIAAPTLPSGSQSSSGGTAGSSGGSSGGSSDGGSGGSSIVSTVASLAPLALALL